VGFVQNILSRKVSPQEAAIASAVVLLMLGGEFSDLERTVLSLLRDQYPPLSRMRNEVFMQAIDTVLEMIRREGICADIHHFVYDYLLPALPNPQDRLGVYRLTYAVAMSNLNVDDLERAFLEEVRFGLKIDRKTAQTIEASVDADLEALYKAVATITVGLMVVTADGQVQDAEIATLHTDRGLAQTLAPLDDVQFSHMYDLALSLYNRFLTDEIDRRAFLYNAVPRLLDTRELRLQAFRYGASICTSDGDVATAEVNVLKDILTAFDIKDDEGEAIFNTYMDRVKSIDGRPLIQ